MINSMDNNMEKNAVQQVSKFSFTRQTHEDELFVLVLYYGLRANDDMRERLCKLGSSFR